MRNALFRNAHCAFCFIMKNEKATDKSAAFSGKRK